MASNYWAKLWIETLDDPKMGRLSDNLWRRFFECVLLAKELNQDGKLPPIEDIAWRLRIDFETLQQEFDQLGRLGLLDCVTENPLNTYWIVVNFEKRQAKMSNAERQKRHRERKKSQEYHGDNNKGVTIRNAETEEEEEKETDTEYGYDFKSLSAYFWKLTGIPEPSFGTDGWDDWDEGVSRLLKIKATPTSMKAAKTILDEGGYQCTRPGALVKTIVNSRNDKKKKPAMVGNRPAPKGV